VFSKRLVATVLFGAAVILTGCDLDRSAAAASPTDVVLKPEIIGIIVSFDAGPHGGRAFTRDTGDVVELGYRAEDGTTATPRVSESNINFRTAQPSPGQQVNGASVLLLAGHGPDGKLWYAAAPEALSGSRCGGYEMKGAGIYDEGSVLHFSTGLIVPKASDFAAYRGSSVLRGDDAFPLNKSDTLCLDAQGTAISAGMFYAI